MTNITFCLMTCGEETEEQCLQHIEPFRHRIVFQEVRNVFPQIKALNQMLSQVETDYLVPLDADMLLDQGAYVRIRNAINENSSDPNWHSILFSLYDTLTERKILALKVLRSKVMKKYMFSESATPDVEHFQRLTDAGYTCIDRYLEQKPIGKHVVQGAHFCYHKYRDIYQTLRSHGFEWDSGVFMGGETILEKSKKHYDFFTYKYAMTSNEDYLYCIAGMTDGLKSSVENKSKTLEKREFAIPKEEALDAYFSWYKMQIQQFQNPAAYLF